MNTETVERPVTENLFAPLTLMTPPDEGRIQRRAQSFLAMVNSMSVDSDQDYELAAGELKGIKTAWSTMEADRTSFTGPLNKILDALNARFQPHLKTLKAAETIIKDKMLGYTAAQERIAAEARRVAEARAQAERDRLAAEARAIEQAATIEAKRVADIEAARVAAANAETARLAKVAADALAAGNAEAARIAEAAAAEQRKKDAVAAELAEAERVRVQQATAQESFAIQNVAAVIVAPVTTAAAVKVAGVSMAKSFDFEANDLHALVKHIAEHPEHISLVMVDTTKVRGLVRSLGLNTNLPGVRVFEKKMVRST